MKKCSKCGQIKQTNDYNFKNKNKGLYQSECRSCTRLFVKNHYNNNKDYYLKKTQARNLRVRKEMTDYIIRYLQNNPCVDCGETDLVVLEFDHNRSKFTKIKAISSLVRASYPLRVVIDEIKKCEVRCANCHRRKTAKEFNWLKNN